MERQYIIRQFCFISFQIRKLKFSLQQLPFERRQQRPLVRRRPRKEHRLRRLRVHRTRKKLPTRSKYFILLFLILPLHFPSKGVDGSRSLNLQIGRGICKERTIHFWFNYLTLPVTCKERSVNMVPSLQPSSKSK